MLQVSIRCGFLTNLVPLSPRCAPAGVVGKQKQGGSRGSESPERRKVQMCTGKRAEAMQKSKQREDEGEREKRRTKG